MLERLVRWSLERPRLIAWACLWLLLAGALAASGLGVDLLPDTAPARAIVQTRAPGLSSAQVEALVTRPIEAGLVGTAGVARVRSESAQGLSTITLDFTRGADAGRTRAAVSERLGSLAGALPDIAPPRLAPLTAPDGHVLSIGLTSSRLDPMALRDVAQWTVRPRLLAADGVARVGVYGGQVRRIEVRARPGDLSDSDLGFLDILTAVKRATSVAGAGFIDTDTQRVAIEPQGQALTPADVGAGQIQTPGAAPVRIDDVADVVEAPAPADSDALIMGRPGVLIEVDRQYGANTLATTGAVERALAAMTPALAAQGIRVQSDLDRPADYIRRVVGGLGVDLALGAALAALGLALLMRDLRAALISLVSVPLTLAVSLIVLRSLGWTINAMTLGGLALGLAVVIDDAVIDVESVLARLRDAEARHASHRHAVLIAALEVRGPVVYATLAAVAALAPILALRGDYGALLSPLAVAAMVTALASLMVAALITPALCLLFLRHVGPAHDPTLVRRLRDGHAAGLGRLTARPLPVAIAGLLLAVAAVGVLAFCRPELLPSVRDGQLLAQVSAPPASSPAVSRDLGQRIAAELLRVDGVRAVSQRVGRDETGDDSAGPEHSRFDVALDPRLDAAGQDRTAALVRRRLADFPGLAPAVQSRFDAGRTGDDDLAPAQVRLYGQDLDALDTAAGQAATILRARPDAGQVQVADQARAPVVRVDIDFQRLALYGLSSADILATIQAAFAGERVARLYERGRVVDLAVSAQASLRRDPEGVGELLVRSTSGISVPLKSVANVYLDDDREVIVHGGGLPRVLITADPRHPDRFIAAARRALSAPGKLPAGVFAEVSGPDQPARSARGGLLAGYGLALFGVFALLALAFDARTGGLILLSTLFAFAGGALATVLMGATLSLGVVIGFIALFALSMRGAILLFSRLEDLVLSEGAAWSAKTVALAVRQRFDALITTTVLVALGLAPLAVTAGQAGREILGPMAVVVIAGLATSTLGVLFIQPAIILAFWRPAWARRARRHLPA